MRKIAIWCLATLLSSSAAAVPAPSAPAPAASAESVMKELELLTAAFEALTKKGLKNWTPRPAQDSAELKALEKERTGFMDRCVARKVDFNSLLSAGLPLKEAESKAMAYLVCSAIAQKDEEAKVCDEAKWTDSPKDVVPAWEPGSRYSDRFRNVCRELHRSVAWAAASISGSPEAKTWCERSRPPRTAAEPWRAFCQKGVAGGSPAMICKEAIPLMVSPEEPGFAGVCQHWVARMRGDPKLDCSKVEGMETAVCEFSQVYPKAVKAKNPALCGKSPICLAAMGSGIGACQTYLNRAVAPHAQAWCKGEFGRLEAQIKSLRFQNATLVATADQKTAADEFKDEISETLRLTYGAPLSNDLQARVEELSRITLNKPNPPNRRGIIMNLVILRDNLLQQRFKDIESNLNYGPDPSRVQKVVTALRKRKQEAAKAFGTATSPKAAPKDATKKG